MGPFRWMAGIILISLLLFMETVFCGIRSPVSQANWPAAGLQSVRFPLSANKASSQALNLTMTPSSNVPSTDPALTETSTEISLPSNLASPSLEQTNTAADTFFSSPTNEQRSTPKETPTFIGTIQVSTRTGTATETASPKIPNTPTPSQKLTQNSQAKVNAANPATLGLPNITGTTGQALTINLTLNTSQTSRAGQFGVNFNKAVLRCDGVDEGTFYKGWAQSNSDMTLVYPQPSCDNTTGTISDMGIAILGTQTGGPSGTGTMAVLHFTVLANGVSPLTLIDVEIDDTSLNSQAIPVMISNGQVTVGSTLTPTITVPGTATASRTVTSTATLTPTGNPDICVYADVNGDGVVNISDLALIGLHWGETGAPGWIPEDVNKDGKVGLSDVGILGICWGSGQPGSPTSTATMTATVTQTGQATASNTFTATLTRTSTSTSTSTPTRTDTPNGQSTVTPTFTSTITPTLTPSPSATQTATSNGLPSSTPTITATPVTQLSANGPSQAVNLNQAFDVPIMINVAQASKSGQFGLTFDPAVLHCVGVDEGTFYKGWAQSNSTSTLVYPIPACNNTAGTLSDMGIAILGNTSGNGPSGSGLMATVHFTALASGSSALTIVDGEVDDADPTRIHVLPLSIVNGQVTVSNVAGASATPTPTPTWTRTPTTNPGSTHTSTATTQPTSTTRTSTTMPTAPIRIPSPTPSKTLSADIKMSFSPAVKEVAQGDTFTVDVVITTANASRGAMAGVTFDPTLLSCSSVDEGTFYKTWAQSKSGDTLEFPTGAIDNTNGKIGDTGITAQVPTSGIPDTTAHLGGASGTGTFLTLHFTAKANGIANLSLTDVEIDDDTSSINAMGSGSDKGQVFIGITPTPTTPGSSNGSSTATITPTYGSGSTQPAGSTLGSGLITGSGTPVDAQNAMGTVVDTPNATEVALGTPAVQANAAPVDTSVAKFDLTTHMDAKAILSEDVEFKSPNGQCVVQFGHGTQLLTSENRLLRAITMQFLGQSPPAANNETQVGAACQLGPTGATFDPPGKLELHYDKSHLPRGVSENRLVIAYYDETAKKWVVLKSQVEIKNTLVTAPLSHFSTYILLSQPAGINWRILVAGMMVFGCLLAVGINYFRRRRMVKISLAPKIIYLLPAPGGIGADASNSEVLNNEALPLPEQVDDVSDPPKSTQQEELLS
ncbi:MAG: cohesin domain-containing protein [Anaerolineaceae bacterium]|nr:cohesin domain-containing protein [Anaerolineaceae bacterium]